MEITRAEFLAASAAAALFPHTLAARRPAHYGVGYELNASFKPAVMRRDLKAIAGDLHADSVQVFGDGVQRLLATTEEALGRGLHVWLQPRLGDVPRQEILDHVAEAGRQAEALRAQGASIDLSVGAEFVLFVPGIVPGADAVERVHNLLSGNFDPERMQRRLTGFIADATKVGRAVFKGRLSYAASEDDEVDWSLFDVVSVDYYSNASLGKFTRLGKPVAIAEFGCCTYKGAAKRGGLAWDVFNEDGSLKPGLVRSEREQAETILRALRRFDTLGLDTATVYQFSTPDMRGELDKASYAIVKPAGQGWEPKEAFRRLAREW